MKARRSVTQKNSHRETLGLPLRKTCENWDYNKRKFVCQLSETHYKAFAGISKQEKEKKFALLKEAAQIHSQNHYKVL
jgi:hypothetical protein